jgi:pimeloyl-ACP methyl ester carboxylesterase
VNAGPLRAPTLGETLWREAMTGREALRLPLAAPRLQRSPRGHRRPVVLVPGLGATDASLLALRTHLRRLGHDARSAELGRMTRDVVTNAMALADLVRRIGREQDDTVALVGQSIGGVLSREVARQLPGLVRRVITFGTPVVGGPEFTATFRGYTPEQRDLVRRVVADRQRTRITVPITAMWSRNDGIVAPAACIDRLNDVEHVEVTSSHLGMGFDPDVWLVIADRLALDGARSRP